MRSRWSTSRRGLRWLASQPEVDDRRIFLWGGSRGAEAALLVAAAFPDLVAGIVANSPSDVIKASPTRTGQPAWTRSGRPLPYSLDDVHPPPQALIPLQRIEGPVLLVCGELDHVWDSCRMSRRALSRLEQRINGEQLLLTYDDLGHWVNRPPAAALNSDAARRGGDDAWKRALAWLEEHAAAA